MAASARKFRQCFSIPKEKINWYPGHMNYSFKHMQAIMRKIDCVIEVHDARIPFSGRNPSFLLNLIGSKPHILVLNKRDLIDKSHYEMIKDKCFEEDSTNVIFTNCLNKKCKGLNSIIPMAVELSKGNGIYPRMNSSLRLMVVGVPNVGKSSLINAIRNINLSKGKATRVGAEAGITRAVQTEIKVHSDPLMFLVDTPGILPPNVSDVECGMKLALCACLSDGVIGIQHIADFLLYWMNKTENFAYVDYFGLSQPVDEVFPLLLKIAFDNNQIKKVKNIEKNRIEEVPDIHSASVLLVSLFRKGKFGDLCLDRNHLCIDEFSGS